jgi:hypothetical protein
MGGPNVEELKTALRGRWRAVLTRLGFPSEFLEQTKEGPCPRCQGNTRFRPFDDFDTTGGVLCSHCHADKNSDGISTYMWFAGVDFKQALATLAAEIGLNGNGHANGHEKAPLTPAVPKASADTIHRAYTALLAALTLYKQHTAALRKRGLEDLDIDLGGYKTLPPSGRAAIADAVEAEVGDDMAAVPGFSTDPNNRICAPAGLLIPARNLAGRIVGIRVRKDGNKRGDRYQWFSSKRQGGPAGEACLHVPPYSTPNPLVVRITEGELKAHVATKLSGILTLSLPGVNCWRMALPVLHDLDPKQVLLAFDADADQNRQVSEALLAATRELAREYDVAIESWPLAVAKGIDDLLVCGEGPTLHAGDRALAAAVEMREHALRVERDTAKGKARRTLTHVEAPQPRIVIDPLNCTVGELFRQITERMAQTNQFFLRAGQLVQVHQGELIALLSAHQLSGGLSQVVEFATASNMGLQFAPLSTHYGAAWMNNLEQLGKLPALNLFTKCPTYTQGFRLVEPGFDQDSGVYYAGATITQRADLRCLDTLLQDFCWQTEGDRTNYLAVLLTALMGPQFVGSKPALLLNGNQPELGKSVLAQIVAILRDGRPAETASYNPNDEEFEKRLGTLVRDGFTTLIIDNAKARGRAVMIESATLERSITDPVLSYRLLGQSVAIKAENSHQFIITANSAEVSRDLATRSVVCNLFYEGDPTKRTFRLADPEGYAMEHREALLGELIGMVERWKIAGKQPGRTFTRFNKRGWGNTLAGILQQSGQRDFLANQNDVAGQMDVVRREFAELVGLLANHEQGCWSATELAEFAVKNGLFTDTLTGTERSRAVKMGALAGRFLRETFPVDESCVAQFVSMAGNNGHVRNYRVVIQELPS